jgi:hypothetical protein
MCVGQPTTTTVALYRAVSFQRLFILAFWNLWHSMHMLVLEPNITYPKTDTCIIPDLRK